MRAVVYRVWRLTRSQRDATMRLAVIVAVVTAIALACAAGARRTTSAPDRFIAARGAGFSAQVIQEEGAPRTHEIASLPGVAEVQALTFVFGGLADAETGERIDTMMFGGSWIPGGATLIEGRAPDPANHGEFVASRFLVESAGLSIGDTFDVLTETPEQARQFGFGVASPDGPAWSATLVGVVDSPPDFDEGQQSTVVFPPVILHDASIGTASSVMWVALDAGVTIDDLRSQLGSLPDSEGFIADSDVLISTDTRTAVNAQGRGLWVLAAAVGLASLAVLCQLVTRHVALSVSDRQRLRAIGFTDPQIVAESTGRAAIVIVVGALLGAILAIAPSRLFPTGFVRDIEPFPGYDVDLLVLGAGAVVTVAVVTAWTFLAVRLATTRARPDRPSATVERLATLAPTPTAAIGVRFAFTRRRRDRGSVRGATIGLVLTVAALVGAITFGASLGRLVDEPARYGATADLTTDDGAEVIDPAVLELLDSDPDVAALMLYAPARARAGSETVELVGLEPVRGDLLPSVISGRLPVSDDEMAVGRLTSDDIDSSVGETVTLDADGVSRTYRVTGIAVIPGFAGNEAVGEGGVLTLNGLRRLIPDAASEVAALTVREDAPDGTLERIAAAVGLEQTGRVPPTQIYNIVRVRNIPFVLAGVLAGLLILTISHVMLTSLRNRRHDLAVLRALGADHRWTSRAMHWQVTVFSVVPLLAGTVVGVLSGRWVFRALADSIGTVNDATVPTSMVVAIVAGAFVLSNGTAAFAAFRSRRVRREATLQTE